MPKDILGSGGGFLVFRECGSDFIVSEGYAPLLARQQARLLWKRKGTLDINLRRSLPFLTFTL